MSNEVANVKDYGKDNALVDVVKKTIFPTATNEELALLFHMCNKVGVHPLDKMIVPLKFKNQDQSYTVSFITTVDLGRSMAEGTGEYDGSDEPEFEGIIEQQYTEDIYDNGKFVETVERSMNAPEVCKVKVYRKGMSRPAVGIARWVEYYPGQKKGGKWRQMPYKMLAKCAEMDALRKGFPKKLHNLYSEEEMMRTTELLAGVPDMSGSNKPSVDPAQVRGRQPVQQPAAAPSGNSIIEDVQVKSGKNDKGTWTKYGVKISGKTYGTFDGKLGELAKANIGRACEFTSTSDGKYNNITSLELVNEEKPEQSNGPEIMGADDFEKLVFSLCMQAGITDKQLETILDLEFSVTGGIKNVPADSKLQSSIIDYLTAQAEQAGA